MKLLHFRSSFFVTSINYSQKTPYLERFYLVLFNKIFIKPDFIHKNRPFLALFLKRK